MPLIACPCEVCHSVDQKDKRLRSSVLVRSEHTTFVIDTGPDFRQQMLRENVLTLDAVLFTHSHKDHLAGLDDVRAYNYIQQRDMDVFATHETWQVIKREFPYAFGSNKYPGVPDFQEFTIRSDEDFMIGDIKIQPILVWHHQMPVMGFRMGDITYITDANRIDEEEMEKIRGSKVFILNALRRTKHISHFSLAEAIEIARKVHAEQTFFTHISHALGEHAIVNRELPEGMELAWDGLHIKI